MASIPATRLMTAEEFMDADLGDGRFELVQGEVVRLPTLFYPHGAVVASLNGPLWTHGRRTGLGGGAIGSMIQTRRDPDTVRSADVAFTTYARWPKEARRSTPEAPVKIPPVAPDVVVEVVSPNDRRSEIQEKVEEYLAAGTLAVWVVRPDDRTVAIHRQGSAPTLHAEGDAIDDQPELPGFRCLVSDIFED